MTTLGSAGATLLLGCGYLGSVMVRRLCLGDQPARVIAVTRSDARHQVLGELGARCLRADLGQAAAIDALRPLLAEHHGDVFALLPPSAWPPDAAASAVAALAARLCASRRAILVSSTAVYGDTGGADVSADSQTDGRGDRSAQLLAIEQAWMNAGLDSYIVRLGGLYGPDRVIGRELVKRGDAVAGAADDWLNVLHIEDAATAVLATAAAPAPLRYSLITDGQPLRRRDYYGEVARRLSCPPPDFGGGGKRRVGSRRCDPTTSWRALGIAPKYVDFRAGLDAAW